MKLEILVLFIDCKLSKTIFLVLISRVFMTMIGNKSNWMWLVFLFTYATLWLGL